MKKSLCVTVLVFLFMLAGCRSETPSTSDGSSRPDKNAASISFIRSMGCNDQNCKDTSHHHDCPTTCTEYDHYHSCDLDCSEAEHHHSHTPHQDDHHASAPGDGTRAFVSGMGCNDQSCTDVSHHHNCPTDCTEYDHYHNCALDCTETSHHHSSQTVSGGHGEHHDSHHSGS